jgi:uncharacterized membrane protein YoaK (UPF0700 family)
MRRDRPSPFPDKFRHGLNVEPEETVSAKSAAELRIERLTWFGLVAVLIIAGVLPEWLSLHNSILPLFAGVVLIASGIYQYRQKWRVHFSTWVAGALMLVISAIGILERPDLDVSFLVIVLVAIVIAIGVFTGET